MSKLDLLKFLESYEGETEIADFTPDELSELIERMQREGRDAPLTKEEFRLYYSSASTDQQTIDVYVEDNFGQTAKLSFEFNSQRDEEKEKTNEDRK